MKRRISNNMPRITLSLLLVSALLSIPAMSSLERSLFTMIYDLTSPFSQVFLLITQLGTVAMWLVSIVVAFAAKFRRLSWQLLIGGGLSIFATAVLKLAIGRPRPFDLFDAVSSSEVLVHGSGFPSGHMALVTMMGLMVMPYAPRRFRWMIALIICAVGLSRIALGVHAPLDLVGGFAIGYLAVFAVKKVYPDVKK